MHNMTMHASATSYQPVQIYESERLLYDLIRTPEKYEMLFERYAAAVVMRLCYGKTVETGDEQYVRDILEIVHTVERVASPGAYLVDTFPILMYLPTFLAPFKQEAARLHERELKVFKGLLLEVRDQMRGDKAPRCFARSFLEKQAEYNLSDNEGAYVIGTLFEAGAGTTAAAMMSFVLCMCLYPEWQTKMQEEVDRVVGDDRIPDYNDIPSLPTCRAVIKEVMRWRPVTAGGLPHELTRDDVYGGFFFPAGTNIHANQWYVSFLQPVLPILVLALPPFPLLHPHTPSSSFETFPDNILGPSTATPPSIPPPQHSTPPAGSTPPTPPTALPPKNSPPSKTTPASASAGGSALG